MWESDWTEFQVEGAEFPDFELELPHDNVVYYRSPVVYGVGQPSEQWQI